MESIEIKGKKYIPVHERIKHLADSVQMKPADALSYSVDTQHTFYQEMDMWVVKAILTIMYEHGHVESYTGTAQEIIGDGYINKTSALENCETSAVGRAFGMAGIGIDTGFASADEVKKAQDREQISWMTTAEKNDLLRRISEGESNEVREILKQSHYAKTWNKDFKDAYEKYKDIQPDNVNNVEQFNTLMEK